MKKDFWNKFPWFLVGLLCGIVAFLLCRKPAELKKTAPRKPSSTATEIVRATPPTTSARPPVSSAGMALPRP